MKTSIWKEKTARIEEKKFNLWQQHTVELELWSFIKFLQSKSLKKTKIGLTHFDKFLKSKLVLKLNFNK